MNQGKCPILLQYYAVTRKVVYCGVSRLKNMRLSVLNLLHVESRRQTVLYCTVLYEYVACMQAG
jgi:hypothetical protein